MTELKPLEHSTIEGYYFVSHLTHREAAALPRRGSTGIEGPCHPDVELGRHDAAILVGWYMPEKAV